MRFVFFGTPKFAAIILKQLVEHRYIPIAVVTSPDKPVKRSNQPKPSEVKRFCTENLTCSVLQPVKLKDPNFLTQIASYQADLFITAAYGKILPEIMLSMPRVAAINVHASLLPLYRGANPVRRALMDGQTTTGVTIIHMVKEMDAGDMIEKAGLDIDPNWNWGILEEKLAYLGAKTLLKTIPLLLEGKVHAISQDNALVTFAPKLEKEECELHFDLPAKQIVDQIRALAPFPGAFAKLVISDQVKRVKLFKVKELPDQFPVKDLVLQKDRLIIGCLSHSIEVLELQLEGKKQMSTKDFLRGLATHDIKII